jgi:hypothetical protein
MTAELTHELCWGKRYDMLIDLNPCMLRVGNLIDFDRTTQYLKYKDIYQYEDETSYMMVALDNKLVSVSYEEIEAQPS